MLDSQIDQNIKALIEFPGSGDAQIKGDGSGNLYHTTPLRNGFGYWGTSFSMTARLIKQTADSAFARLRERVPKLWQALNLSKPASYLRKHMLRFKEDYREKEELIRAIEWIFSKYATSHGEKHVGVVELAKTLKRSKKSRQLAAKNFSLFMRRLNEWNRGKDYYLDSYLRSLRGERSKLLDYCGSFSPSLGYRQVMSSIEKGRLLHRKIQGARLDWVSEDEALANEEIASLTWYLIACALEKGALFRQGTLVLEDPENRLFHFFHSYIEERGGQYEISSNILFPGAHGTLAFGRVKHPTTALFKLTLHPKESPGSFGWLFASSSLPEGSYERRVPQALLEPFKELAELMPGQLCEKLCSIVEKRGVSYIFSLTRQLDLLLQRGGEQEDCSPLKKPILYELYYHSCQPENPLLPSSELLALPEPSSLDRSRMERLVVRIRKGLSCYSDLHLGYRYGDEVLLTREDLI